MASNVRLVSHPSELSQIDLRDSIAVVFDVLRATTTIVTALAQGASEVRAFADMEDARLSAGRFEGLRVLAGERACLPPPGFDLGNSPLDFSPHRIASRTVFLSTTNGTRAIRACSSAKQTFVASLCNATATARRLADLDRNVVLVCSGVDGQPGGEDVDGAMTVADVLSRFTSTDSWDSAFLQTVRERSFMSLSDNQRLDRLLASPGGLNLIKAGLERDIEFCARVDRFATVAGVAHGPDFASIRSE